MHRNKQEVFRAIQSQMCKETSCQSGYLYRREGNIRMESDVGKMGDVIHSKQKMFVFSHEDSSVMNVYY